MRLLDTKRRVKASRVVRYEQANMGGKLFFFLKKTKKGKGKESSAGGGGTSAVAYCDGSSRESGRDLLEPPVINRRADGGLIV